MTVPDHPFASVDADAMSAQEVLALVLNGVPRVALACSFQKEEAVLVDMAMAINPATRIFALDTHVLFPETYAAWAEMEARYGIKIEVFEGPSLAAQAEAHGDTLWERDQNACCGIRKIEPLGRALADLDAWITGIRREQSPTRANAPKLGWDGSFGLWKANPIADWTEERVWDYIRERDLPVNALHAKGYESIGCTHCTAAGSGREGRWAGSAKTECGLHLAPAETA